MFKILLCSAMSTIILVFVLFHLAIVQKNVSSVLGIMISDYPVSSSLFEQSKNYRNEGGIWQSAQQLLTIIQWLFSFKRIVTDLKFSTNQMLYQPSWIKDKVIRQRFWRDPFKEYHSRPQIRGQGLTKFHLWAFGFGEQKKRNTTWFRIFVLWAKCLLWKGNSKSKFNLYLIIFKVRFKILKLCNYKDWK